MKQVVAHTFDINNNEWKSHLAKHGYVVFATILDETSYAQSLELFWKDISAVSPQFTKDVKSWSNKTFPGIINKGMCPYNRLGNCDFVWSLRCHPAIQAIFHKLYDTEELVVSMDGFSVFYSYKQKTTPWLHVDQFYDDHSASFQGMYYFFEAKEASAAFLFVEGSHTKTYEIEPWGTLKDQTIEATKLLVPKNSFVLWNSKLVHSNTGPIKTKEKVSELNRLSVYLTFFPRKLETEEVRQKKIAAYKEGFSTSHYAYKCEIKTLGGLLALSYKKKNFNTIKPKEEIPMERMKIL